MSQVWNAQRIGSAILLAIGAALALFPGGCSFYVLGSLSLNWLSGTRLPQDSFAALFVVVSLVGLLVAALGIWLARRAWRALQKSD